MPFGTMPNLRESPEKGETARPSFPTIDDCIELAHQLVARLDRLGEQKHPLDVRRGVGNASRREVEKIIDNSHSRQIKAGSRTYFLDVDSVKGSGAKYLKITESRFLGQGKERERHSIVVFAEYAKQFTDALSEMVKQLV